MPEYNERVAYIISGRIMTRPEVLGLLTEFFPVGFRLVRIGYDHLRGVTAAVIEHPSFPVRKLHEEPEMFGWFSNDGQPIEYDPSDVQGEVGSGVADNENEDGSPAPPQGNKTARGRRRAA